MTYQSISINHPEDGAHAGHCIQSPSTRKAKYIALFVAASFLYITLDWLHLRLFTDGGSSKLKSPTTDKGGASFPNPRIFHSTIPDASTDIPIPTGVNLGSWLSLEDWFYVGSNGAVEVASPDEAVAASCLPPLHLDESTGPRWNSETDLMEGLGELTSFLLSSMTCKLYFQCDTFVTQQIIIRNK